MGAGLGAGREDLDPHPGHGGRAVALSGAPLVAVPGLDALDAALGELRAAGWQAPEDARQRAGRRTDGRDSIADRLSDGWTGCPPGVNLRPSADWPDRAIVALGSAVAALVVMCAAVRVHPWRRIDGPGSGDSVPAWAAPRCACRRAPATTSLSTSAWTPTTGTRDDGLPARGGGPGRPGRGQRPGL